MHMSNSEIEKMGISLMAMNQDLNGVVMLDGHKVQSQYLQQIKSAQEPPTFKKTSRQSVIRKNITFSEKTIENQQV